MKNIKNKIGIIFVLLIISSLYFVGESFARYVTSVTGDVKKDNTDKIEFAKFVVNSSFESSLNVDINNFYPGSSKTYDFCVTNYRVYLNNFYYSDITIKYRVLIKSYALPLQFALKKDDNTTINLNCSGTPGVTCNSVEQELSYTNNNDQCYVLTVTYPETITTGGQPFYSEYSDSIDVVNLTLESWQKG